MNDRELEARLREWYGDEVGAAETAPVSLRRDVAAIPRTATNRSRRFGRGLTLLAAAALLLVGGALAAGSGLVRQLSLVPPEPAPSLAADAAPSPADESSRPTAVTSPAPTGAPSPVPGPAGTWIPTRAMGTSRLETAVSDNTAVRLVDGRVLVVASADRETDPSSAELYDPDTATWTATGTMLKPHTGPATLLLDGTVLVGDVDGAEVYDPDSGTWTATGATVKDGAIVTATLLRDGKVLATGPDGCQVYDPGSGTWTATGRMITRGLSAGAAVLLPDGRVLVAGGLVDDRGVDSAELYDPATGTWAATASMHTARDDPTATLLLDGTVLVTGGANYQAPGPPELYDPAIGTWTDTGDLAKPGSRYQSAAMLPDGKVLVTGANLSSGAELYDPATRSWITTGSTLQRHGLAPTIMLLDGTVLVAGGVGCSNGECYQSGSAELYVPAGVSPPSAVLALPSPTPTPSPTPVPTPVPPQAGPIPPGARSWKVTVSNMSSEPATLFVAEETEQGLLGPLVGSATPNVVAAGATVKVTFLLPAKGTDWAIFVNPGPNDGPLVGPAEMSLAGQIKIAILSSGQPAWASP